MIEEIFIRLDKFRADETVSEDKKENIFEKFKDQLNYEVRLFKENVEGQLMSLIKNFYDEKFEFTEMISKNYCLDDKVCSKLIPTNSIWGTL